MRVTFRQVPSPLDDSRLLLYEPTAAEHALAAASRGDALERVLAAPEAPDAPASRDSLSAVQRQLRQSLAGRSHRAWSRAFLWFLLGPALTLLWIALLQLVLLIFGLSGGPPAIVLLWLLPLIASWRRAWNALQEARTFGRLTRAARGRRLADAPLATTGGEAQAALAAAIQQPLQRLRALVPRLAEHGSDAAGEATDHARQVYFEAARRGMPEVSRHFHALYVLLAGAERRMARLETSAGGVLSERKVAGEASRATRAARQLFAPFRPTARIPSSATAPVAGAALGLAALALAVALTGLYYVPEGAAMAIDPLWARAGRLVGQEAEPGSAGGTLVRDPGIHWTLPYPLASRAVTAAEPSQVIIRGRLRRASQTGIDMVEMQVDYRVVDPAAWARLDADGSGRQQLALRLSRELDGFLQNARQQAANALAQQSPALMNDRAELQARTERLVEARMQELLQLFLSEASSSGAARSVGIQVSTELKYRIVPNVPDAEANAPFG